MVDPQRAVRLRAAHQRNVIQLVKHERRDDLEHLEGHDNNNVDDILTAHGRDVTDHHVARALGRGDDQSGRPELQLGP